MSWTLSFWRENIFVFPNHSHVMCSVPTLCYWFSPLAIDSCCCHKNHFRLASKYQTITCLYLNCLYQKQILSCSNWSKHFVHWKHHVLTTNAPANLVTAVQVKDCKLSKLSQQFSILNCTFPIGNCSSLHLTPCVLFRCTCNSDNVQRRLYQNWSCLGNAGGSTWSMLSCHPFPSFSIRVSTISILYFTLSIEVLTVSDEKASTVFSPRKVCQF